MIILHRRDFASDEAWRIFQVTRWAIGHLSRREWSGDAVQAAAATFGPEVGEDYVVTVLEEGDRITLAELRRMADEARP